MIRPVFKVLKTNPQGCVIVGNDTKFVFEDNSCKKVVLIGAGSGVAPLRGILQYILKKKLNVKPFIYFYYKTKDDIIYKDELEKLFDSKDAKYAAFGEVVENNSDSLLLMNIFGIERKVIKTIPLVCREQSMFGVGISSHC